MANLPLTNNNKYLIKLFNSIPNYLENNPTDIKGRYTTTHTLKKIYDLFDGSIMNIYKNMNIIITSCPICKSSGKYSKPERYNLHLLIKYLFKFKINTIVCPAKLYNSDFGRGFRYFPKTLNKIKTYIYDDNNIVLKCIDINNIKSSNICDESIIKYIIEIRYNNIKKKIKIIQYDNWGDHKLPQDIELFNEYIKYIYEILKQHNKIVMHCCSGIGRSGIVTCCIKLYHLLLNHNINQKQIVKTLYKNINNWRKSRINFVHKYNQFYFCYKYGFNLYNEINLKEK